MAITYREKFPEVILYEESTKLRRVLCRYASAPIRDHSSGGWRKPATSSWCVDEFPVSNPHKERLRSPFPIHGGFYAAARGARVLGGHFFAYQSRGMSHVTLSLADPINGAFNCFHLTSDKIGEKNLIRQEQ